MATKEDPRASVSLEQQRVRKILAEASENKSNKKSAQIVKYIVEHIYQDLKNDLGADDIGKTQLGRVKKCLLKGTEFLIQSVSDRFFNEDEEEGNETNSIKDPKVAGIGATKPKPPVNPPQKNPPPPSMQWIARQQRSRGVRLYPPPSIFIKISIPSLGDSHSKALGLITDPENVTFHINMKVIKVNANKLENNRSIREVIIHCSESESIRRHSEIKKLCSALMSEFPYLIIPPHPSKHSIPMGSGIFQNDSKKDFRQRTYALWLEYVMNLPLVHTSESLPTFFNCSMPLEGIQPFDPLRVDNDFHRLLLPFIEEVTIGLRQFVQYDFTPEYRRVYYELYDEFTQIMKTRTYQDILNIRRDLKYITLGSNYFQDALRQYVTCYKQVHSAQSELVGIVNNYTDIESKTIIGTLPTVLSKDTIATANTLYLEDITPTGGETSCESLSLSRLSKGLTQTIAPLHHHMEYTCYHLLEPAYLLYGGVIPVATTLVDKSYRCFASDYLISPVMTGATKEEEVQILQQAQTLSSSWDTSCKLRAGMMLTRLIAYSEKTLYYHRSTKMMWKNLLDELEELPEPICQQPRTGASMVHRPQSNHNATGMHDHLSEFGVRPTQVNSEKSRNTWYKVFTNTLGGIGGGIGIGTASAKKEKRPSASTTTEEDGGGGGGGEGDDDIGNGNGNGTNGNGNTGTGSEDIPPPPTYASTPTTSNSNSNSNNTTPVPAVRHFHAGRHHTNAAYAQPTVSGDFYGKAPAPAPAVTTNKAPPPNPNAPLSAASTGNSTTATGNSGDNSPATTYTSFPRATSQSTSEAPSYAPMTSNTGNGDGNNGNGNNSAGSGSAKTTVPDDDPLPHGWVKTYTDDGRVYYYHEVTRESRWTPPPPSPATDPAVSPATSTATSTSNTPLDDTIADRTQKRLQAIDETRKQQEAKDLRAAELRQQIAEAVQYWKTHTGTGKREKDIGELLSTLHMIISTIGEGVVTASPLTAQSDPSEIKKAYMKAVRQIHPDKYTADMVLEEKLLAEEVFIVLSEEYNNYRKTHS